MSITSFPRTYQAISEMIDDVALSVPMARSIARKGGLRSASTGGSAATGRPRTILDTWIVPSTVEFENQWYVDLTGYSLIRFSPQNGGADPIMPLYSLSTSTALDPGDWQPFALLEFPDSGQLGITGDLASYGSASFAGTFLGWHRLPGNLRRPMRLTVVSRENWSDIGNYSMNPFFLWQGPFNISIQVQ